MFPGQGKEEALKRISEKATLVRSEMGNRLRNQLRHIPEFVFFIDDSLDYIDRIDDLLNEGA
jgi:ribosome-binding factor A